LRLEVSVLSEGIDHVDADVAVVGCLADERPLRGAAARADWRLCGAISSLLCVGDLQGDEGEAALFPSSGGVRAPRLLALGLGVRSRRRAERLRGFAGDALERVLRLRASRPALALLPPEYGDVRDQVGELVAGLAEVLAGSEHSEDEDTGVRLRLLVAGEALSEAQEALAQLACHHWPPGIRFRGV
jgi:hypothetical protein